MSVVDVFAIVKAAAKIKPITAGLKNNNILLKYFESFTFLKKIARTKTSRNEGVIIPIAVTTEPINDDTLKPTKVLLLIPMGPGVISAMAIILVNSSMVNH